MGLLAQALHKPFYLKHLQTAAGGLAYKTTRICLVPYYDHRYVTEAEGYPDLVVHGPLIALLLLEAGSRRLGGSVGGSTGGSPDSFSYRAVSPLFCGEEFTIAGKADPDGQTEVWAAHPERGVAMRATLGSPP